jgi:NhaA family Na+:H+ antiporter
MQQNKPIDTLSKPLKRFLNLEAASGIMLIFFTVLALVWANSPLKESYYALLHTEFTISVGRFVFSHSLQHMVNDALMCVFFFIIGLELKREFAEGELKNPKSAALPIFAALGGMIVPALLFLTLNTNSSAQNGWGIVMATDIAFAVGVMALLGSRISNELKIFLLTLAVVDDIGAILVIAVFYSGDIGFASLGFSFLFVGLIAFFYKLGVRNLFFFAMLFLFSWFFMLDSGIHSTILGVILGLMAPSTAEHSKESFFEKMEHLKEKFFHAAKEDDHHQKTKALQSMSALSFSSMSMLERLEMFFHPWNIFYVLPLFALFNAGFEPNSDSLFSPLSIAIAVSLFIGKPLGVIAFSYLGVYLKIASLPSGAGFRQIAGVGFLAGIGFTMSIFISALAFGDEILTAEAKGGIFMASLLSGFVGYFILKKGTDAAGSNE